VEEFKKVKNDKQTIVYGLRNELMELNELVKKQ
jgi:hypothetical protein